ncbi:putative lipid II flippase MurJ [Azospirillaceae bacterium]
MLRSILSVGGLTLVSRILGFVRDVLTAAILGAGPIADAFFIAFRLPNHFRSLFAEGAFNAAFVPVFSEILVRNGRPAARTFAGDVYSALFVAQLALLALFLAIMPWFMTLFAPGFIGDPIRFPLSVLFTRITFPYLLFISLVALMGAMLNSLGRFAAAAAAPILLNLCLIGALIGLAPLTPNAGYALSWGVLLAGVAQYVYLLWDCRRAGINPPLGRPRMTDDVRKFLRVLGPAALGSGLVQINLFIDTLIASFLPTGAVSYLYYADRLNQLPLGVIGIAVGTVLLPEMAKRLKSGDETGALDRQNRALEMSLLLTLPAAVALIATAEPIMTILFQRGAFTTADAAASANTLMAYAVGLPAFVVIRSLTPGFHARQDTTTPVRIALIAVGANIGLKLVLMGPLAQVGLALGTSLSAWINAGLLTMALRHRGFFTADARLRRVAPRMTLAALALGVGLKFGEYALADWLSSPLPFVKLTALTGLGITGLVLFALSATKLGGVDPSILRRLRRGNKKE